MQERHKNREKYFQEQSITTKKYVIPYINTEFEIKKTSRILEIGCGEGGNLLPFLELGCNVVGVDILPQKIENAKRYYQDIPEKERATFFVQDIYKVEASEEFSFDIILMRDTIEHIPDQNKFLSHVKQFLKPKGIIFFAFPPWRMPFGGHQQICRSKILSTMPYFHILPSPLYAACLKIFGESIQTIQDLKEIKDTRLSIQKFYKIIKRNNFVILKKTSYLINPNYEIKFGLNPRVLPKIFNIPILQDFYTTALYCIVKKSEDNNDSEPR